MEDIIAQSSAENNNSLGITIDTELRKNLDYLEKLNNSLGAVVFVVKLPERIIEYINNVVEPMFGYAPSECIGLSTEMFYPSKEAYLETGEMIFKAMKAKENNSSIERIFKRKNGEQFPADIIFTFKDIDSVNKMLIGIIRDISEKKKAVDDLYDSQERYRCLVENVKDGIWEIDQNFIYTYVNPRMRDISGYDTGEIVGKSIFDFIPASEHEQLRESLKRSSLNNKPLISFEKRMIHKGRWTIVTESSAVPFFDAEGRLRGYRGVDRDITKRKIEENELNSYREYLEQLVKDRTIALEKINIFKENILSTVPSAIVVVNQNLEIVMANEKLSQLFNVDLKDAVNSEFCKVIKCNKNTNDCNSCLKASHKDWSNVFEFEKNIESARAEKIIKFYVSKIVHEEGRFLLIMDDITRNKLLEQQVLMSERLASTGKLAASIAHEINNPLQGIMTHLEIIKDSLPKDFKEKESYNFVEFNIGQIKNIVRQLLDIYRNSNKARTVVYVNDLIFKVKSIVENQMRIKGVNLILRLDKKNPSIMGWEQQLHQVVLNLLLNALDSTLKGGAITVTSSLTKDMVLVSIKDTGKGIRKEDIERIFDPFFSTKKTFGVGLGLFVCQGFMKNHKGTISVKSQVGKGTVFTLSFPLK